MLSNTGKLRILVVDDHAGMREGISAVVNAQPDMSVVGEAGDGQEAIQRFRDLQRALCLGAKAYLHKDMLRRELLPAIRAVHQGQQYLPDKVSEALKRSN